MGLSLGFENIVEPVVNVINEQDINMYKHYCEIMECEAELRELETQEAALYEGCENILLISQELKENGVSETLKNIVGEELAAIGITLEDADIAQEGIVATVKAGVHRIIEFIKKMYAIVVDYLKKFFSTQKSMAVKLKARAKLFQEMKDEDFEEIKKMKVSSAFDAKSCENAKGVLGEAAEILPVIKKGAEGWKAKVKELFSKYQTGYGITVDANGKLSMTSDTAQTAKSGKTVGELGWTKKLAESVASDLGDVAAKWANNPVYTEAQTTLANIMKEADDEAKKDEPDEKLIKEKREEFNATKAGMSVAGKVLLAAEKSVLAIPTKVKKAKEEPKKEAEKK